MKKVRLTTKREQAEIQISQEITVKSTNQYCFVCDGCLTAFSGDDKIIVDHYGTYRCPQEDRGFFQNKACLNRVYCYSRLEFDKYYRITSPTTNEPDTTDTNNDKV